MIQEAKVSAVSVIISPTFDVFREITEYSENGEELYKIQMSCLCISERISNC